MGAEDNMGDPYDETSAITKHMAGTSGSAAFTSEPEAGENGKNGMAFWRAIPKRYILAFMAFLGFANVYALRVNLSVAIVAMTRNYTVVVNGTTETRPGDFSWDNQLQGHLLAAFFWGYIVTQLPGGMISKYIGGKYIFGGGIFATACLTLITPPVARTNVYLFMVVRILEGLFEGVTYPCVHSIWSKWAPPLERSKLSTIAFSGSYFGTVVSMPISGIIADRLGWDWVFYIFGMIAVIWVWCWFWFIYESPADHPDITQAEVEYIQQSIGFTCTQTKLQPVPWKDMLLSLPVWAICVAHFAENWGFYTMLTELPSFLHDVMHFDLYKGGLVAALPYLVMCVAVQIGGQLADGIRKRGWLNTTNTRKVMNCTAFLWQMIFLIAVAYTRNTSAAIVCLTLSVGVGGFAWSGFSVNHLDIAPQFASVLMGISNTFGTIPGIVSPVLTGTIVQGGTYEEWRIVFYIAAAIYGAGAVWYAVFASGEKQGWAEIPTGYEPQYDDQYEVDHVQETEQNQ